MKRPFACIGLSMLFSLVFAFGFHTAAFYSAAVCFVLSAVLFAVRIFGKKKTITAAVCCLSASAAMFGYCAVMSNNVEPLIDRYNGETAEIVGTVVSKPYTWGNNTYFTVKTESINNQEEQINIQISCGYTEPIEIYDKVTINAELYSDYEFGYGLESYYGARGIFLKAYINPYVESYCEVEQCENRPFYAVFSDARDFISKTFRKYLSYDEASLCTAVLTGEKSALSDDVYSDFKNLGVSHMLVVSGLHLSIVAGMLYYFSTAVKNRYLSALIQLIGVTAFAALSGFGFSVRRALVMIVIVIMARLFAYHSDALNSLGLAALVLCLNPLNVGDIGLLWSFACTLSLILFAKPINDFLISRFQIEKPAVIKLISPLSAALAALVGSLPFSIFVTGSLSPYTILVNVLTVPFTGIVIVCGGLSVFFFALNISVIGYPLIFLSGLTAKYLLFVTRTFSNLPLANVSTSKNFVYVWFAVSVLTVTLFLLFDKNRRYVKLCALSLTAVIIGLYSIDTLINSDKITVSVLDVGCGITVTVKKGEEFVLLNSFGEKYQYSQIKDELSQFNKISCIVDTPPDKTGIDYCRSIINEFDADTVLLYDRIMFDEDYCYSRYTGINTVLMNDEYTMYLFDGAALKMINTQSGSFAYLTVYETEILICPPSADFSMLPDEYREPDIAVAADVPDNFHLQQGTYTVVSSYGEECTEYIDRLSNEDLITEATNGHGRIDFCFSKNGSIETNRVYTGGVTRYADD